MKHKLTTNMKNISWVIIILIIIILLSACNRQEDPIIPSNNWQTIYQNNDLNLFSINYFDKDHVFVMAETAAEHGLSGFRFVLSTLDGGKTWNQITCFTTDSLTQFPLYDICYLHPISENVLLAAGYQVHISRNKGETWTNVSPQLVGGSFINDLYVMDSITWIVAKGTEIYRTNNGGHSWQNVFHTDFMGALQNFSFPSRSIGYITDGVVDMDHYSSVGLILKTIDEGQSWSILKPEPWKSSGTILPYITAMQFNNDLEGYLSTFSDSKLYETFDGGNNWELINNNHYTGLQYFITTKIGFSSDWMTIYVTKDGGKTWQIDYKNNAPNSDILTWTFLKTGQGYALTRDHRIIKNINLPT